MVLILAAVAGFSQVLDRASSRSFGDTFEWPIIFLIAAVAGPIFGIIVLYIIGAVFKWTGSWIGGKASFKNIRIAVAWSNVPILWALLLWLPELLSFLVIFVPVFIVVFIFLMGIPI
ncbi:MAG: YIP1 family protein [Leptospirales bacterium]